MAIEISGRGCTIGVGLLPGRRSYSLYTRNNSLVTVVAYFRSEADSNHFLTILATAVGANLMDIAEITEGPTDEEVITGDPNSRPSGPRA